jgi:hypothetical protein
MLRKAPKHALERPIMKIAKFLSPIFVLALFSAPVLAGISNPNAIALSKAMMPEAQFKQMTDAIVQTGMNAAKSKIESDKLKIDLDKKGKDLEKSLRDAFTYDYFVNLNAKTMSKNFNEAELGKILSFFTTEVGKKWTKHTPEIISETMMQIQLDLQEKLPKFVDAMAAK